MIARNSFGSISFDAPVRVAAVGLLCLITAACDRAALLAPTNSRITLTAASRVVPLNGTTELQATVLENSGSPVPNGTTVRFTTSLGRIDPVEATTRNGVAVTTFQAGNESGVAQITAVSGLATATGGTTGTGTGGTPTPTTGTAGNVVEITIGAAAVRGITLSANPGTLRPSGSSVEVSAFVNDANGNPVRSVPVTFTTTRGTITPALANTDTEGVARATLTASETATVTARVGGGSGGGGTGGGGTTPPPTTGTGGTSATIEVRTATTPSFTLATTPESPSAGQPVVLTITPSTAAAGGGTGTTPTNLAPRVIVNWGDGDNDDIGVVAAPRSVTHIYDAPGFYTITARGTQEGEEFTNATAVTVAQRPPVELRVDPTSGTSATVFTFTITPTTGALIQEITIDYGDGQRDELGAVATQTTRQHQYAARAAPYTATVTQRETNGNVTRATVTVSVTGS
jgi:hypothetical protein